MSEPVEATSSISQDLQNQLNSAAALETCFNLIKKAPFPYWYGATVDKSLKFIQALHEQVIEAAKKHPEAYLVPALAPPKEEMIEKKVTSKKGKRRGTSK